MENIIKVTFIGLISGMVGTSIGGLSAFFVRDISNRFLAFILEFSAGLMTAVVCFELLPEAFSYSGVAITFIGVFAGILTIVVIENYIRKIDYIVRKRDKQGLLQAGILMAIGIALHNLPEGFAVGSGFKASVGVGITLTIAIVIHDVPEGIAMAVPLRVGGITRARAFILTVLSGLPMGVGAFMGVVLGGVSSRFIGVCLGFAAGAMLYVIYGELLPQSKKIYTGRLSSIGNILGVICGIIVSVCN